MFKGFVKMLIGCSLCLAPLLGAQYGMHFVSQSKRSSLMHQKETIISDFENSERYKKIVDEKYEDLVEDLVSGEISGVEYDKLKTELESPATEEIVIQYSNSETAEKLAELNRKIKDAEEIETKGIIMMAASLSLGFPVALIAKKLFPTMEGKDELVEEYLNKPVIV